MSDFIESVKIALGKMGGDYCRLAGGRYQERTICYEFYHQFRNLLDSREVNFGGRVVQAEVDKRYQQYSDLERKPDFIFHVPDTQDNLAVMEFKMADNLRGIREDREKLATFGAGLDYRYLVQVIIGTSEQLNQIRGSAPRDGSQITVILFATDSWRAYDLEEFIDS